MSIDYKVVSKRPAGMAGDRAPRYYPVLTNRTAVDLNEFANLVSERSSFHRATIIGVINAMMDTIPGILKNGGNVRLDGLGTFSVHASSKGKDEADKVTSRDIDKLKMSFLPDKALKKELNVGTAFNKVR
jgi:predicted histone-like DNA-binding protein